MKFKLDKRLIIEISLFLILVIIFGLYINKEISKETKEIYTTKPLAIKELIKNEQTGAATSGEQASSGLFSGEKVLAATILSRDKKIIVTDAGRTPKDKDGFSNMQAKIWIESSDGKQELLKTEFFPSNDDYFESVGFNWDTGFTDLAYAPVDVQIFTTWDGPFSYTNITHDYVDTNAGTILATAI